MSSSFADLGVPAHAVRALNARRITSAFPIQAAAIPPALKGQDICGRAPTGSGKTIAFGIPVAARVEKARPGRPRALILAPTRELAGQIASEMAELMGKERRQRVGVFYGGVGFGDQLKSLRRGVDVAVACPGRLKDLIGRGAVALADVSIVVIDEADRMADMGFLPEVKAILDQVRPDRQTLLFSATLDGEVDQLVKRYQRDPVRVTVEAVEDGSSTSYEWLNARREDRIALTAGFVDSYGPTIVFCRTKHGADRVAKQLAAAGAKAVPIHGGRTQSQREQALKAFSSGRAKALVATDVAARGIHVDDVGCVVHFDLPATAKDYLHRSGRTGRAGSDGVVISFVTPADRGPAKVLQKAVGHPVSKDNSGDRPVPVTEEATRPRPKRPARNGDAKPTSARPARPGNRARKPRRGHITEIHGQTPAARKPKPGARTSRPRRPSRRPRTAA